MCNKKASHKERLLLVVTPAGFKPATPGAEIQCSIQLSYGAISGKIRIYYNNNLFFS
jgi:hypothetical protein